MPELAELRPCRDPSCPGAMEPEQDGDTIVWSCGACGYEDYEQVQKAQATCAAGVPLAAQVTAPPPRRDGVTFLGSIGRRPS